MDAVKLLSKAINAGLSPRGKEYALVLRARALIGLHRKDLAWRDVDAALAIEPTDPEALELKPQALAAPSEINLPSGLTLGDWLNLVPSRLPKEADQVLAETATFIGRYGPIPQLVELRDRLVHERLAGLRLRSAESAQAAEPALEGLVRSAPDNLEALRLFGLANHLIGNYDLAREAYVRWLRLAPPDAHRRSTVVADVLRAANRQPPADQKTLSGLSFDLPDSLVDQVEQSAIFQTWPAGPRGIAIQSTEEYSVKEVGHLAGHSDVVLADDTSAIERTVTAYDRSLGGEGAAGQLTQSSLRIVYLFGGLIEIARGVDSETAPCDSGACASAPLPAVASEPAVQFEGILDLSVEGSLFPMAPNSAIEVRYKTADGASNDVRCTATKSVDAKTLQPSLTGLAWEFACTATIAGGSAGSRVEQYSDYYLSDYGLFLDAIAGAKDMKCNGASPAACRVTFRMQTQGRSFDYGDHRANVKSFSVLPPPAAPG